MSHVSIRTAFASAILTVAALGVANPAEAAVYRTFWDPPYGQWFPDLGWSGTSALFIPDACLVNSGTVACAGMTAGFAQAELFSLSNPSSTETLAFNQIVNLSSATFANGQLTAVNSDFFSPVLATLGAAGGGAYSFSLKFTDQGAFLFHLQNGKETSPPCGAPSFGINTQSCGYSDTFGQMSFSLAVPEPETYAMLFAGLGLLGFTARRRKLRLDQPVKGPDGGCQSITLSGR